MSAAHSLSNWAFFFIMKRAMPETTMTSNACVIGRGAETKWLYESCTVRQHSPKTALRTGPGGGEPRSNLGNNNDVA